jgi:hypothetical protein
MSTDDKTTTSSLEAHGVCSCCGIAEVDDIKLKICDGGCDLVKYCSDDCQENHREQHGEQCKKRKKQLHDKRLFSQPDINHMGECPICCLPLSIDRRKSILATCCSKYICMGCDYANVKREREQRLEHRCPFCREPISYSQEEHRKRLMERVKKNDPVAMTDVGKRHEKEGDYEKALEYWTKAAELGYVEAHACLATLYLKGNGVEKDIKGGIHHLQQAAIGGHTPARGLLANCEKNKGRLDRAAKHLIINANLGCDISVKMIKDLFVDGIVSKDDYATTLRAYQAAVNETKSDEREKAEAVYNSV